MIVKRGATFSDCGRYRYLLSREWDVELPSVTFVMLNPSTADGFQDDPTIRRCIGFARRWGFGKLEIANLFAWRSTDPQRLGSVSDPVGPENDSHLKRLATVSLRVVAAWGVRGGLHNRDRDVLQLLSDCSCLGTSKQGFPKHPLYISYETPLEPYPGDSPA